MGNLALRAKRRRHSPIASLDNFTVQVEKEHLHLLMMSEKSNELYSTDTLLVRI